VLTIPLYPFQEPVVDRMVERGSLLLGCGMGTGKTVMAIAAIEELFARDEAHDAMIICPASLRWQWAAAIARVTDTGARQVKLKKAWLTVPEEQYCRVLDGTVDWDELHDDRPDYLICSYEFAARNVAEIRHLQPDIIVCDEAQMIKNSGSARTKAIKKLNPAFRFAATGTPMDNGKPEELFSIMQWVDKDVLGRWDLFDKAYVERNQFGGVKHYKNLDLLHRTVSQAMERKTADDPEVAAFMPSVEYEQVFIGLTPRTRALYSRISADLSVTLENCQSSYKDIAAIYHGGQESVDPKLGMAMAQRTAMRMLLDHPQLLVQSAAACAVKEKRTDPGNAYALVLDQAGLLDTTEEPKLVALCAHVDELLEDPEAKGVIFTSYATMLPILAEALADYGPECFDGSLTAAARSAATARFATDPACRLLLATDAGGAGLDLPVASFVVNYDPPQGLGRYLQRNARHQRAGSRHKVVRVVNLICKNSIEEHDYAVLWAAHAAAREGIDGVHTGDDFKGVPPRKPSLRRHLITN
jgi:SNF2 family DNA or RNA helicase